MPFPPQQHLIGCTDRKPAMARNKLYCKGYRKPLVFLCMFCLLFCVLGTCRPVLKLRQYSKASFVDSDSYMNMKNDRVIKNWFTEAVMVVDDLNYCEIWSCSGHILSIWLTQRGLILPRLQGNKDKRWTHCGTVVSERKISYLILIDLDIQIKLKRNPSLRFTPDFILGTSVS